MNEAERKLEADLHALVSRWEACTAGLSDDARVALARQLLGKAACRRLGIYPLPADFLLSVVIPVYNEVETLAEVVERVRNSSVRCEMIIVDDGSDDGTAELLGHLASADDVRVLTHERNLGKGAALRTAFPHVRGDAVLVQDADLEYDPAEYRYLLQPIIEDEADVVYGSRFLGDEHRVLYYWHYVGNRVLTSLSNVFTNLNLTDMETCYKVFRRDVIERIAPQLREQRFGIEPEITARVAGIPGVRVFERPISYCGRTYAEGKKIGWRDGWRALWCVIRYGRGG